MPAPEAAGPRARGSRSGSDLQPPPVRPDGLQVEERRDLQRRLWRLQRLAWIGFAAVIAAALAGLTGAGGPLAARVVEIGEASAEVPRIARWQAPSRLALRLPAGGDRHVVEIGGTFGDGFAVERILPEPAASVAADGATRLEFAADGDGPHRIVLSLRPDRPGLFAYSVSVDGRRLDTWTLVLP